MRIRSAAAAILAAALLGFLVETGRANASADPRKLARATFAGGCFWCMEPAFERLPGVISVTSGFSGGTSKNPTYREVSSGRTDHLEAVQVRYDPRRVSYARLLEVFWSSIDPTQSDGQFCDRGKQYRSAIFVESAEERRQATESARRAGARLRIKRPIVTPVRPFTAFYPAEEYHQDYYKKNPEHYAEYREGCGRDRRLRELWGDAAATH